MRLVRFSQSLYHTTNPPPYHSTIPPSLPPYRHLNPTPPSPFPPLEVLGSIPLILTILLAAILACKGFMVGCKRGTRVMNPKLGHSAMVMTGATNWVVITYTLPKKPPGYLRLVVGISLLRFRMTSINFFDSIS